LLMISFHSLHVCFKPTNLLLEFFHLPLVGPPQLFSLCWSLALVTFNTKDLSFKPCSILARRELAQLVVCGSQTRWAPWSSPGRINVVVFFTIYIYFFFIIWCPDFRILFSRGFKNTASAWACS
jgi:hypothetical protein